MLGWMNYKLESRFPEKNIKNLIYADDTTLKAESKEELRSLLMKVKEKSEKAGLKLNIEKTKIMASNPTTLWQTDGGKMETVADFIFLGSKITVNGNCSHEIWKMLAPWKESYDKSSESESVSCSIVSDSGDTMDCTPPSSSVHGILQAWMLEWVAKSRQHIKKQRYHFANKGPNSQSYDFSSSHVQMWELDHKEG